MYLYLFSCLASIFCFTFRLSLSLLFFSISLHFLAFTLCLLLAHSLAKVGCLSHLSSSLCYCRLFNILLILSFGTRNEVTHTLPHSLLIYISSLSLSLPSPLSPSSRSFALPPSLSLSISPSLAHCKIFAVTPASIRHLPSLLTF